MSTNSDFTETCRACSIVIHRVLAGELNDLAKLELAWPSSADGIQILDDVFNDLIEFGGLPDSYRSILETTIQVLCRGIADPETLQTELERAIDE